MFLQIMSGSIHYVEIVAKNVDTMCKMQSACNDYVFGPPDPSLGGARVAVLPGGGQIAVRAPLREDEAPMTRVYHRVPDCKAATAAARDSGAEIGVDCMDMGAHGVLSIVIMEGIETGFWQVPVMESRQYV